MLVATKAAPFQSARQTAASRPGILAHDDDLSPFDVIPSDQFQPVGLKGFDETDVADGQHRPSRMEFGYGFRGDEGRGDDLVGGGFDAHVGEALYPGAGRTLVVVGEEGVPDAVGPQMGEGVAGTGQQPAPADDGSVDVEDGPSDHPPTYSSQCSRTNFSISGSRRMGIGRSFSSHS